MKTLPNHKPIPADAATVTARAEKKKATRSVVDLAADVRTLTRDGEDAIAQRDQALRVLAATLAAHRAGWGTPDLYAVALLTRLGLMPEPGADPHEVLMRLAQPSFADLASWFSDDLALDDVIARSIVLPVNAHAPGRARRFVVSAVADWCLYGLDEDAATVASELVTNVVRHADSATVFITVSVDPSLSRLLIEVGDDDPTTPEVRDLPGAAAVADPGTAAGEGGAGLVIVRALSKHTEVRSDGHGGKVVAAELLVGGAR
jgi:serine/threonine-protein kinase RsbW